MKKLLAVVMAILGLASSAGAATIDLSTVKSNLTLVNGDTITGMLNGEYRITIAAGAKVRLKNAYIYGVDSPNCGWVGLTCEGDATIYVEDVNGVRGFHRNQPGIFVPVDNQLTITGTGKYALSQKRITLIGISFSAEKRAIVEELVEEL